MAQSIQNLRSQPIENFDSAFTAQRGIAVPTLHDFRVKRVIPFRFPFVRRKEPFGEVMHLGQTTNHVLTQCLDVLPHQTCDALHALFRFWHDVGLRIVNHLNAMLYFAVRPIVACQNICGILGDPALFRQMAQGGHGTPIPQIRVPAASNNLAGLCEKFDLANTAASQLHIMSFKGQRPPQTFVLSNTQPHIVSILNGREIQMLAPHKWCQRLEKPRSGLKITCRRARLDIGGAFPRAAKAFVIAFGRFHGQAHWGHRRIRPQSQIGSKNITIAGQIIQHSRHFTCGPNKAGAGIVVI